MKNTFYIFTIIFLLLYAVPINALEPVELNEETLSGKSIGKQMEYLEDIEGKLTIEDVSGDKVEPQAWKKNVHDSINHGFTHSIYWFRFSIKNSTDKPIDWYFNISYPLIDLIDFYIPRESEIYQHKQMGDSFPFNIREVKDVSFIFSLNDKTGQRNYYFRINTSSSMTFTPVIMNSRAYLQKLNREQPVIWIYYGMMIIMVVYNLFIYISSRDESYLFYGLFITSWIMLQMCLNGYAFQYLWPDQIWWASNSLPFFINFSYVTVSFFAISYIGIKNKYKRIYRLIIWCIILPGGLMSIVSLLVPYNIAIKLSTAFAVVITPVLLGVIIILMIRKSREAMFMVIAFTGIGMGILLYALKTYGILPANFFTQWSIQIGSALVVLLLSLGLADKINVMRRELAWLNIDLEKRVDDRTRKLQESYEKLKELDKLKSNFFANISHEIRTPLTLILAPVESILQGDAGFKADDGFFKNIQRNALRLLGLVNNLLDFSKIEAGRMTLRIQKVDIVSTIRHYLGLVQSAADSKDITLSFKASKEPLWLYLDLEKTDKIALNLVSNALKFTERGGLIFILIDEVLPEGTETSENNVVITISDTGVGIPPDKIDTIFERFSQADMSSTRKFEGTGIGLSLAKELVEMHGGTITAESRYIEQYPENHGSTFRVTIPCGRAHFAAKAQVNFIDGSKLENIVTDKRNSNLPRSADFLEYRDNVDNDMSQTQGLYGQEELARLLVVEDNPDMRDFLVSLLSPHYLVLTAVNGIEGLEKARNLKPDIIISDVMMPEMNGYDMTRHVKDDPSIRTTPVLLLTAKADISQKIEGLEYGADDYLTKPFNSRELFARVRALLKSREGEKAVLHRNREIEEELETARLLQRKLLPDKNLEVSGYTFHSLYIPMDKVGGDFYDYTVRDGFIDLFIADVSGHGLPGAFLSTVTKMALDSITNRASASRVQYQLNDVVCRSTVRNKYVTSFFCKIDIQTNNLSYCGAGHVPPLIFRRRHSEFIELKTKGSPLGWFKNLKLEEKNIMLIPGDLLILYTDGITECMNSKREIFSEERFREFIRSSSGISLKEFSESLLTCLRNYSQTEKFEDDLTMVVFEVQ
jgi:signal transduction histidine kinase/serine phosphatase RsbU (regulator of sigma subunit)